MPARRVLCRTYKPRSSRSDPASPWIPLSLNHGLTVEVLATGAPLTVAAPITISWPRELLLDAAGALNVRAPVAMGGPETVQLDFPTLNFDLERLGFAGSLSFTGTPRHGQALFLDNQALTPNHQHQRRGRHEVDLYALARPVNATGTTHTGALIGGTFTGGFNGQRQRHAIRA